MTKNESTFRRLFLNAVSKCPKDAGLFLSGGVDSLTTLAAMLHHGMKPACFTFNLSGRISKDRIMAEKVCKTLGLSLMISEIPTDLKTLVHDVRLVLEITKEPTKTHVQCAHPFLYMGKNAKSLNLVNMTWGMGATWSLSRNGSIANAQSPEAGRELRRKEYFDVSKWSGDSIEAVLGHFGITVYDPWYDPEFEEWFLDLTLDQLHYDGQEKTVATRAFPEFWRLGSWYKKHDPLQVGSGIRELHDKLLSSIENKKGNVAVVGVYGSMLQTVLDKQISLL